MKIVAISDTHNRYDNLIIPECDLLISCGDFSGRGTVPEVKRFHAWLNKQPAKNIISVMGNHEKGCEENWDLSKQVALEECPNVHFIDEGLVEIEGIKIWCSAITPYFCNWAWNRERGMEIKEHWDKIPEDINILVTHGPPYGILDLVPYSGHNRDLHVGCKDLLEKILTLPNLKHHFFGHVHNGYGHLLYNNIRFWNVSICDERYQPSNLPVIVDF